MFTKRDSSSRIQLAQVARGPTDVSPVADSVRADASWAAARSRDTKLAKIPPRSDNADSPSHTFRTLLVLRADRF